MLKNNANLEDRSPKYGVYEGDLKYGRALGSQPKQRKDFPADRINGHATNKPIVPLVPAFKRNASIWSGRCKAPKKISNPPTLATEIVIAAQHYPYGLIQHLNPSCVSHLIASF